MVRNGSRRTLTSTAGPMIGLAGMAHTGWQLLDFAIRRRGVRTIDLPTPAFYLPSDSIEAGEPFQLHIHCPDGGELVVRRLEDRLEPSKPVLREAVEPVSGDNKYSLWRGLSWPAQTFHSGLDWKPGLYLAELESSSGTYRQALIVTSAEPSEVAVVLSTNTWAAYNDFGGLSNYEDPALPLSLRALYLVARVVNKRIVLGERRFLPTVPLPRNRPNRGVALDLVDLEADPVTDFSHLVRAEWALLRYLDSHRAVVQRLHRLGLSRSVTGLPRPDLVVFTAHSEYWSAEMLGRLTAYVGSGGHALFVSGNNCYREVRHGDFGLEVIDQKIDAGFVAGLLGTGYTAEGYETYAPFRVVDSSHQVFNGLDLTPGDIFGGPDDLGNGASGHETDKLNSSSGVVDVLAIGTNPEGPAFMTWKNYPNGGWVCNFSSVQAAPWVERCPVLGSVVRNIIDLAM